MAFDDATILAVWEKGEIGPREKEHWRMDACGAWMLFEEHENPLSVFGWKINRLDGIYGSDDLANLRPLQWNNNILTAAADGHLRCAMTSQGNKNVPV